MRGQPHVTGESPGKIRRPARPGQIPAWTFLSNHAHVLLIAAAEPEIRLREVADRVGITERAVQRIVADLVQDRYLERERVGRRNRYRVHQELPMRHPLVAHNDVGALLRLLGGRRARGRQT